MTPSAPIPEYRLQSLRALDAVLVIVWANGEQVAHFWGAELDDAAMQAGDFVGQHLTGLRRRPAV